MAEKKDADPGEKLWEYVKEGVLSRAEVESAYDDVENQRLDPRALVRLMRKAEKIKSIDVDNSTIPNPVLSKQIFRSEMDPELESLHPMFLRFLTNIGFMNFPGGKDRNANSTPTKEIVKKSEMIKNSIAGPLLSAETSALEVYLRLILIIRSPDFRAIKNFPQQVEWLFLQQLVPTLQHRICQATPFYSILKMWKLMIPSEVFLRRQLHRRLEEVGARRTSLINRLDSLDALAGAVEILEPLDAVEVKEFLLMFAQAAPPGDDRFLLFSVLRQRKSWESISAFVEEVSLQKGPIIQPNINVPRKNSEAISNVDRDLATEVAALQAQIASMNRMISRNERRGTINCFRCGKAGHIARNCKENIIKEIKPYLRSPEKSQIYYDIGIDNIDDKSITKAATTTQIFINVEEKATRALIDTGASISVINGKYLKEDLNYTGSDIQTDTKIKIRMANQEEVTTTGTVVLDLSFNDTIRGKCSTGTHLFHVMDSIGYTAILGVDILEKIKSNIALSEKECKFDDIEGKRCTTKLSIGKAASTHTLYIMERIKLKPFHEALVPVYCKREDLQTTKNIAEVVQLVQGITQKLIDHGWICAAGVTKVEKNGSLIVKIANMSNKSVVLARDQDVATLTPLKNETIQILDGKELDDLNEYGFLEGRENNKSRSRDKWRKILEDSQCCNNSDLSPEQKLKLMDLLITHAEKGIFGDPSGSTLKPTNLTAHRIDTGTAKPINKPPYRKSMKENAVADEEVEKMVKKGIIRPSRSPWSSPVVLVKKRDGSIRFCVDYRELNDITKKDAYPIPRIDDTLQALGQSAYFSTLDLESGYWQVPVAPEDREKTAFSTQAGHFEFVRMPFGLCNAPSTFQRLMDMVLAGLKWNSCLVYLDDIIIFSPTFEQHLVDIKVIFERLLEADLTIKPTKCHFCKEELKFLGHVATRFGTKVDPNKVDAISKFPRPQTVRQIKEFVGMTGYYREFIPHHAQIARPLYDLLKGDTPFRWTETQENAFNTLKEKLATAPVLAYPNFTKPFQLHTDASSTKGVGAALIQVDENGKEHPLGYASKGLTDSQKNYSVTEIEAWAVVWGIRKFRPFLEGRKFTVVTDHRSLKWLMSLKDPSGRLARWALYLQGLEFEVVYKEGKQNRVPDALSRNPVENGDDIEEESAHTIATMNCKYQTRLLTTTSPLEIHDISAVEVPLKPVTITSELRTQFIKQQETDTFCQTLNTSSPGKETNTGKKYRQMDGLWYRVDPHWVVNDNISYLYRIVVPRSLVQSVISHLHDDNTAGHMGEKKTYKRVCERFWWPTLASDVKQYVRSCERCHKNKTPTRSPYGTISAESRADFPCQQWAMDAFGPMTMSSNQKRYVLVFQDYFTRFIVVVALRTLTAKAIAKAFLDHVVAYFGAPRVLFSDNDSKLAGKIMEEACKLIGTKQMFSPAYHPESNGQVERMMRPLRDYITTNEDGNPKHWDYNLPSFQLAYNTAVHATTGYAPFTLMHSFDARLPLDSALLGPLPLFTQTSPKEYLHNSVTRQYAVFEQVKRADAAAKAQAKERYDKTHIPTPFTVGDLVWLYTPVSHEFNVSAKLKSPWTGPWRIVEQLSTHTVRLRNERTGKLLSKQVVHVQRLKPYFERTPPEAEEETLRTDVHPETLREVYESLEDEPVHSRFLRSTGSVSRMGVVLGK